MSRWNLAWLLGVTAVTLVGLSLAYSFSNTPINITDEHDDLRLLIDARAKIKAMYVKPLDKQMMREMTENMLNGALEKLDPHSGFMNKEEYADFNKHSEAQFGGVGIRIRVDGAGQILVETPLVGTPAYNAGILAGDLITKVNGQNTDSKSVKDVVEMIQGPKGSKVTLTVIHEGETKEEDLEMVRAEIEIDSVLGDTPIADANKKWDYLIDKENQVAYIRITAFTQKTVAELTKVVQELQAEGMKGLIIDLRTNPGGLLRGAVQVSGMFLKQDEKVVSTKSREKQEEFTAHPPKGMQPILDVPIVILINRYSASASEIVAAALQDHLRAVIIGERSYGKGSVQNIIEMENGTTALKLTTASYWRPSGKNIHRFPTSKKEDDWGVKPDIEVKIDTKELVDYFKFRREKDILHKAGTKSDSKLLAFKDKVLDKAKEVILEKLKKPGAGPAPAKSLKQTKATPAKSQPASLLFGEAAAPQRTFFWCHEKELAAPFISGLCFLTEETRIVPYYPPFGPEALPTRVEIPRLVA